MPELQFFVLQEHRGGLAWVLPAVIMVGVSAATRIKHWYLGEGDLIAAFISLNSRDAVKASTADKRNQDSNRNDQLEKLCQSSDNDEVGYDAKLDVERNDRNLFGQKLPDNNDDLENNEELLLLAEDQSSPQ